MTEHTYTKAEVDDAVAEALHRVARLADGHENHQAGAGGCILDAVDQVAGDLRIRVPLRPETGVTAG
jgi:hypothetical protein